MKMRHAMSKTNMTKQEAWELVGGLSAPSKMPSVGYSLPARACITGSRLAQIKGTVCYGCYALKGNYQFPMVQACLEKRLASILDDRWTDAMVTLIQARKPSKRDDTRYFRWHDSGDLQSVEHLRKIARIAVLCPTVTFWLPTREYQIVETFCKAYTVPVNLVIRLSAHKIDGPLPAALARRYGLTVSGVHTTKPSEAKACPAQSQGNKCLNCRACWKADVFAVSYHKH